MVDGIKRHAETLTLRMLMTVFDELEYVINTFVAALQEAQAEWYNRINLPAAHQGIIHGVLENNFHTACKADQRLYAEVR